MAQSRYGLSLAVWLFLAVMALPSHALAQSASHLGLGVGENFYYPSSGDADRAKGVAFVYRWHSFHSGWGPTFALDLHKTGFTESLGDGRAPLGSVGMRALLVGFGHTQHFGRFSGSASATGGYSLNRVLVDGATGPAYERVGLSLVGERVRNSPAGRAETSFWYDVTKRVGLGVSAGYFVSRPEMIITTTTGSSTRRLRADAVELQAGVVLGLWKDHHSQ